MENTLERLLDETLSNPGVVGVLCADKQGLCLSAKGTASPESSGIVVALSQQAALLKPETSTTPVICLESDKGNVLVKSHEGTTLVIHKMAVY
ncbi:ragulator complex protein LAMTOR5-like [Acanthaster planci]|uniref:Late endosomal/lysosomal adaptor and MAPK and MTOR activator 5 n=1 Tax=Acanthaster planci TaxID=133434 RepID=A0A8B7XLP1_ACAPL|nr:ragulator complex protein LAMTOR5-like [Acanthaster planci]